jgi:hypothetical protein
MLLTASLPQTTIPPLAMGGGMVAANEMARENWLVDRLVRLERGAQRYPMTCAVIGVALLMALVCLVFAPSYQTNDDAVMSMIASGAGIATSPSEFLPYTNVIIGSALKSLYRRLPDWPWYGTYLLAVHFVSHVAILYTLLSWRYCRRFLTLYVLLFAVSGVYLVTNLQFTSTAFLAVFAGVALGVTSLERFRHERAAVTLICSLTAAGLLVLLGSLVRWESFLGAVVVAAPLMCAVLLQRRWRTIIAPAMIWTVLFAAAAWQLHAYHVARFNQDPRWCSFFEYNALRVRFNDYRWIEYTSETRPIFDQVGWSKNDLAMLNNWYFDDPDRFSAEKLRHVLENYPRPDSHRLHNLGNNVADILRDKTIAPLLLLLPIAICFGGNWTRTFVASLLPLLLAAVMILAVAWLTKPVPNRVYYPMLAFPLLAALTVGRMGDHLNTFPLPAWPRLRFTARRAQGRWVLRTALGVDADRRSLILIAMAVAAIVALGMNLDRQLRRSRNCAENRRLLYESLAKLEPSTDQLYVCWGASFPFEWLAPLDSPARIRNLRCVILGWPQQTPMHRAMKQHFQIDDLAKCMVERPDVRLIANSVLARNFANYVAEHYAQRIRFDVYDQNARFSVYEPLPDAGRTSASRPRVEHDAVIQTVSFPVRVTNNQPGTSSLRR